MVECDTRLTNDLIEFLKEKGAKLVGVGNMTEVKSAIYPVGIAVAMPIPVNIIRELQNAPTINYYNMYYQFNNCLNDIVTSGADFLKKRGYQALAQTTSYVKINNDFQTNLPHKTVATRAGLGWIGKNCLLVTPQYGSAVRISSLLTNAPLKMNKPINISECGSCTLCQKKCPANAIKGTLWKVGMDRSYIFDKDKCYKKQKEIMLHETGIDQDLCGKCFAWCAYTLKYINSIK